MWKVGFAFIALAAILSTQVGCAGRVYIGFDRTDAIQEQRTMNDKAWYCTWVACPEEIKK